MKNAPVALSSTHLYIADNVNALVDVIDTTTDILETTIPVGRGATAVALTPDFKTGYVANSLDNTVSSLQYRLEFSPENDPRRS